MRAKQQSSAAISLWICTGKTSQPSARKGRREDEAHAAKEKDMSPMKFPISTAAADFEPVPAGSHIAVCDMVVYLGIQPGSGLYPKPKPQLYMRYELPNERIDYEKDDKKVNGPCVIGKTYTASMNEKANLRHDLENWRGKAFTDEEAADFDVSAILGKPCMLSVIHKVKGDKTYANISGIGGLPKGISAKSIIPETAPIYYGPDNEKAFPQLPEWLRKKIEGQIQPEQKEQDQEPDEQDGRKTWSEDDTQITDDDIPF
jgi:hypothetical protein